MLDLSDYEGEVKSLVKDSAGKLEDPADYHDALRKAARWYSQTEAREIVEDLTSDGTDDYSLPSNFEDRYSEIVSIEHPISGAGEKPAVLDDANYEIARLPSGLKLRLYVSVAAGQKIRVTYTARHILSDAENTLPDAAFEAVTEYAAGCCFDRLAAVYTPTTEDMPQGDFSVFRSVSDKYKSQAKAMKASAEEKLPNWVFV